MGGYFAIPTLFAGTSNDWRLTREEIFGPVLVAIPWREEADAIRIANDSHYGLAAYVWTHDCLDPRHRQCIAHRARDRVGRGAGELDSFTQRKNVTVNFNTPRGN